LSRKKEPDDRVRFEADLRTVRERAQLELQGLDEERRSLRRLIATIDRHLEPRAHRAKASTPANKPDLLELVREHPGIRVSMAAQLVKGDPEEVLAEVRRLESSGRVRRTGLGWTATP
jgi:hypothetical protein